MSSDRLAVRVRDLSKIYRIGSANSKSTTAAEAVMRFITNPFRAEETKTFSALSNLSFDIVAGDVVGIVGRNGAGKSTLLKILSRITEPTKGQIDLFGRVGSLLEVGTGFHPELTGRENIFLNGAILGMSRLEISKQFDAIVDFSGTEKFLETPVKRYSSGMYVRLAFAVAAHLNPEILIIDEVLAVGDAEFQQKCLGKMQAVARSGKTVIFVSHNIQSISLLCNKGLLLSNGQLMYYGDIQAVIEKYLLSYAQSTSFNSSPERRPGTGDYRFTAVTPEKEIFASAEKKSVNFRIERKHKHAGKFYLSALLIDKTGATIAQFDSRLKGLWLDEQAVIEGTFSFDSPWLKPGSYRLDFYICSSGIVDQFDGACFLEVSPIIPYPNSTSRDGFEQGLVFADFTWETPKQTLFVHEMAATGGFQ